MHAPSDAGFLFFRPTAGLAVILWAMKTARILTDISNSTTGFWIYFRPKLDCFAFIKEREWRYAFEIRLGNHAIVHERQLQQRG